MEYCMEKYKDFTVKSRNAPGSAFFDVSFSFSYAYAFACAYASI